MGKIKMAEKRVGGGTPLDAIRLEEKRVFDAAFYRFNAIQNSSEHLVRQNARNFGLWCVYFAIPTYFLWQHFHKDCLKYEQDCRDGKIAINANNRRHFWFMW